MLKPINEESMNDVLDIVDNLSPKSKNLLPSLGKIEPKKKLELDLSELSHYTTPARYTTASVDKILKGNQISHELDNFLQSLETEANPHSLINTIDTKPSNAMLNNSPSPPFQTAQPQNVFQTKTETNTQSVPPISSSQISVATFDNSQFHTGMVKNVPENKVVQTSIPLISVPNLYNTISSHEQSRNGLYAQGDQPQQMEINHRYYPVYRENTIQHLNPLTAAPPHRWVLENNSSPQAAIQQSHNIHHHHNQNMQTQFFQTEQPPHQSVSFVQQVQNMFRPAHTQQSTQQPIYYPPISIQSYPAPITPILFQGTQQPLPTFPTFPTWSVTSVQPTTFATSQYLTPATRPQFQYTYATNTPHIYHHTSPEKKTQQIFAS